MKDFFWNVFEKSGSIDAIMAYFKLNEVIENGFGENKGINYKRE